MVRALSPSPPSLSPPRLKNQDHARSGRCRYDHQGASERRVGGAACGALTASAAHVRAAYRQPGKRRKEGKPAGKPGAISAKAKVKVLGFLSVRQTGPATAS